MREAEQIVNEKIHLSPADLKIIAKDKIQEEKKRAFHEEIEIKYFYKGSSAVMINSNSIMVEEGDITIVNPYENHSVINNSEDKGHCYLIIVGLDFFADYHNGPDLRHILIESGRKFDNLIRDDKRLQTIILRIMEEVQNKEEYYQVIVRNLMSEFFALLIRNYLSSNDAGQVMYGKRRQGELISPALSKIHTDYQEKFTVEELAKMCNVSKYHFCRIFKQVTNVTPMQYIVRYRIGLAEILLKETKNNVSEIAEMCGFNDESYFYRCYKKIKGVSPKRR